MHRVSGHRADNRKRRKTLEDRTCCDYVVERWAGRAKTLTAGDIRSRLQQSIRCWGALL